LPGACRSTEESPWKCVPNANPTTPFPVTAKGDIVCMSSNGIDCLWRSPTDCEALATDPIPNPSFSTNPAITCAPAGLYNSENWCFKAAQRAVPPPSQCERRAAAGSACGSVLD
jgi:hypothetical protein